MTTMQEVAVIGRQVSVLLQVRYNYNRERIIGELFLASHSKASYFRELFLCKLDDLK